MKGAVCTSCTRQIPEASMREPPRGRHGQLTAGMPTASGNGNSRKTEDRVENVKDIIKHV